MDSFEIVMDVMPTIGPYAIGVQPCACRRQADHGQVDLFRHAWVNYPADGYMPSRRS